MSKRKASGLLQDIQANVKSRRGEPEHDLTNSPVYVYEALENPATHIRLFRFAVPQSSHDDVDIEISSWELAKAPGYVAISYTWGPVQMRVIGMNDYPFEVRENCHAALQQVKARDPTVYVWLDSICIDQANIAERNAQVNIMKDIYLNASRVFVCIGPHADGSESVVKLAGRLEYELNLQSLLSDEERLYHSDWRSSAHDIARYARLYIGSLKPDEAESLPAHLAAGRSYWSRVWIVQEIIAAGRNAIVLCGSDSMSGFGVYLLGEVVYDAKHIWGHIGDLPGDSPWYISPYMFGQLWNDSMRLSRTPLQELMEMTRSQQCTDRRDHVYGLLALVHWPDGIAPIEADYSKALIDVAAEAIAVLGTLSSVPMVLHGLKFSCYDEGLQLLRQRAPRSSGSTHAWSTKALRRMSSYGYQISATDTGDLTVAMPQAPMVATDNEYCKYMLELCRVASRGRPSTQYPQRLMQHGKVIGLLCHNARPGDIFLRVFVPIFEAYNESTVFYYTFFVIRKNVEATFDVIGQGIRIDGNSLSFHDASRSDCLQVALQLTVEDAIMFVGQDMLPPNKHGLQYAFDSSRRIERLFYNPVTQPKNAVMSWSEP